MVKLSFQTPKNLKKKLEMPATDPIIPNQYAEKRILNTTFQTQKLVNGMMTKSSQNIPVKTVKLDVFVKGDDASTPRINNGITKTRVKRFDHQKTETKPATKIRGDVDDVMSNVSGGQMSYRSNKGTGALWNVKKTQAIRNCGSVESLFSEGMGVEGKL